MEPIIHKTIQKLEDLKTLTIEDDLGNNIIALKGQKKKNIGCKLPRTFRDSMKKCYLSNLSPMEQMFLSYITTRTHKTNNNKTNYDLLSIKDIWTEFTTNDTFRQLLQDHSIIAKEIVSPANYILDPNPEVEYIIALDLLETVHSKDRLSYESVWEKITKGDSTVLNMLIETGIFNESTNNFFTYNFKEIQIDEKKKKDKYNFCKYNRFGYALSCKGEGNCLIVTPIDLTHISKDTIVIYKMKA